MHYPFARSYTRKCWVVWYGRHRLSLWRRNGREPLCVTEVWVDALECGRQGLLPCIRLEDLPMRKPEPVDSKGPSPLNIDDKDAWKGFPHLRSFLLDTCYAGVDSKRLPGVLMVTNDGLRWTWTLKDPTACTQLRVSGNSWDEVQLLAETLLADPKAPWALDHWAAKRRPRGGK